MVGGGPAGAAAAIVLATSGARVVLLEKSAYDGARVGETLPPEVRLPLERLGAWDGFRDDGHVPSPGIVAAWGGPEPYANDFIVNPYGNGWRVDRKRFDAMLTAGARQAGATVLTNAVVRTCVAASAGGWTLEATHRGAPSIISAGFVVDATGRTSAFCRSLGAAHRVHDRMVAVVGFSTHAGDDAVLDQRALIEATDDGWWYSGGLPDGRLVLAFHTDPAPGLGDRWTALLGAAPETRARVGEVAGTGARVGEVAGTGARVVSANSHRMQPVAGQRWLAVGDAATAHDPLTGLGIYWALESGIAGAEAIVRSATRAYGSETEERFGRYLDTRAEYYRAERRWPDAPFWRRRQQRPVLDGKRPGGAGRERAPATGVEA